MTLLTNNAEGGTSGTTVTTGNSGGASGNAFDVVSIGTGAALTFDNTHAAHGSLAYEFSTGSTSGLSRVQYTTAMGTQSQVWFRLYCYLTANPAATIRLWDADQSATACGVIVVLSTGHLQFRTGSAGTQTLNSTNAVPLNAWWRLEGFCTGSATTGQVEFKLYTTPDSTTPLETQTSASNINTTGTMDHYSFGISTNTANVAAFWEDDLGLSSTGYIGPALSGPSPVISQYTGFF